MPITKYKKQVANLNSGKIMSHGSLPLHRLSAQREIKCCPQASGKFPAQSSVLKVLETALETHHELQLQRRNWLKKWEQFFLQHQQQLSNSIKVP